MTKDVYSCFALDSSSESNSIEDYQALTFCISSAFPNTANVMWQHKSKINGTAVNLPVNLQKTAALFRVKWEKDQVQW